MWTVESLQQGYPGKSKYHGGLGWSTVALARGPEGRIAVLDTGGFGARRRLLTQLAAAGVAPEDVTDLLLTHLHYDHCINWPMFRRATIHVGAAEMDMALALPEGDPLYPGGSPTWGRSPRPGTKMTIKTLGQDFVKRRMGSSATVWATPSLSGKWVLVLPVQSPLLTHPSRVRVD